MKNFLLLTFVFLGFSATLFAQNEASDSSLIQQQDTGFVYSNVNVFKDARLDILETRPAVMHKIESEIKAKELAKADAKAKEIPMAAPIKRGRKTVTGSIHNVSGYRVVIYNGSDRAKANEAKIKFMRSNPGTRTYMTYNVPSYKIKVGDFEGKGDAYKFLRRIQGSFPSAFVAPDIVTVKNINVSE